MTAKVNKARKAAKVWDHPLEEKYVLDHVYAFSRGEMMVATTNTDNQQNFSPSACWSEGTTVCNIFNSNDCQKVQGGKINIQLNGSPKIYMPKGSVSMEDDEDMVDEEIAEMIADVFIQN
jgi:hypothetical protein